MPHSNDFVKYHDLKLGSAKLARLIKERPDARAKPRKKENT
jgi:hypothetical protein